MMKIYNSLTRKKENFKPIHPGQVKLYVCGPTVYDFAHIGNARTYAAFDVVVRYLRFRSYDVTYVRNITDIDDKIIKRANENKESFTDVVTRFTNAIHEDFTQLGLLKPNHEPRATEYIPQIIAMIEKLIANQHAYIASNGDVYYDVRSFETYGALAHRNIDQLESGARVEINDVKRDPLDFVLWKLAKPGEPHWESPWGVGRPGWHIECSAMTTALLGDHFDIHGGGKDLIFPHHENEIAQSEAANQQKFVNTWMHAGFLQIEKTKMSKSLGNFFTIRDVLNAYPAEVLRYFLISSHYRSPIQYSENGLQQAQKALERLYTALRDLPHAESLENSVYEEKFIAAMDDDFNTPIAFSVLFDLAHEVQRLRQIDLASAGSYGALLKKLSGILHILQDDPEKFFKAHHTELDVDKIENLIKARNTARASKDWAEADRVRAELTALSIVVEDGANGTTWKYIK
ncbi:MAG TPA: cysteine--tRNA ligase [Gammaproteobacteria bacterium]|jgi:cysteinyl-tRNA synthetase|nr:cysteine--tRNA ligase [Gammaproteobacteria bacterium]